MLGHAYIFKTVQILVTLATSFAVEGLLLLHTECAGVGSACLGIDNGKCAVTILVQLLCLVAMRLVISGKRRCVSGLCRGRVTGLILT